VHADADGADLTIDELAAAAGTTTRRIRSLQTLALLPHPGLRGRTGLYGPAHRARLAAILRLQEQGFSLESLKVLFRAEQEGRSLGELLGVLGASGGAPAGADTEPAGADAAELYGFAELEPAARSDRRGRRFLSVVPTTLWDEHQAS
jgi:DNA-binding transcriptional MerR regulator